ncbi:unnamed protein product [Linum tenue]|uniref:Uncharacterized protein n=1 Tax=Linum tenue TaxID=586396 RepID=A0AAV0LN00_9ROSI|nr:unnamed protein product [Linum tenue]
MQLCFCLQSGEVFDYCCRAERGDCWFAVGLGEGFSKSAA